MAQSPATREPASVVAGDTVTWSKALADYPASAGWTLNYRLINAAGKIDIAASASGDSHLVLVAAATTAAWKAGSYAWQAYVTKATERYTVGSGSIVVKPDLTAPSALDTRSAARQTLDLLDAAMVARGSQAWTQEYEIAGRRMKFTSASDFMAYRSKVVAEVAREDAAARIAAGLASKTKILVRF